MSICHLRTPEEFASLLSLYDTWLFDCDGVLWNGDELIDGAVQVLEMLRQQNKSVLFVSNNSTKSRRELQKKFTKLGVQAHLDEIYCGTYVAAVYISSVLKLPKNEKVYVIGMKGLEEELSGEGILFSGGTDPTDCSTDQAFSLSPQSITPDPTVSAILCGLDFALTYTKIAKAFHYLNTSPNCHFIAVNTYPTVQGSTLPGAGAIAAALCFATRREPVCAGKPSTLMLECVRAKLPYDPTRTIMVGDRLDADILFGKQGGLATLLVLTGVSTECDVKYSDTSSIIPEYVADSIGDFCSAVGIEGGG